MPGVSLPVAVTKEVIREVKLGDFTWVDIVPPTVNATQYLSERFHFQTLALEDCLSRRQISKVDVFADHLFCVFHFSYYDKKTRISNKRQWSAFAGNNYLVTIHTGELRALSVLFRSCQDNEEIRQRMLSHGSGYLLYGIIDRAIDSYFPVLDKIMNLLEEMEDSVFDEAADATKELSVLRRDIITQRMVMFPTRNLLNQMRNKLKNYCDIDITQQYDDLIDHMDKICQTLDECQETIEVFKDTDYTLVPNKLNRVLRTLNIFATIVLPFVAVSGIYGMNIPLPGGLDKGSFSTFFMLLGFMAGLAALMLFFFRRRRWI